MATQFDPYLQWLGIRDPQRPPNHYRLLGLELFESDANVIAMSADRQMAHLRNFKTGPQADLAQRLLNELSAARVCLLKPERKAAYDGQLRASQKPAAPPKPATTSPAMPTITPVLTTAGPSTKFVAPPAKAAWKPWAILAGLLLLCVGLTVLLINKNKPAENEPIAKSGETPKTDPKPKPQSPVKPAVVTPVKTDTTPETADKPGTTKEPAKKVTPPEVEPKIAPLPEKTTGNNPQPPNKEPPTSTDLTPPSVDPTKLLGEETEPKTPEKTTGSDVPKEETEKKPEATEVAVAPPVEPEKPKRTPVPDKATITAKEKEIREIFAEEYKSQKPEIKIALATKLRQSSADSKGDAAMRYVLLNEARANAIFGGAVKLAVEISDELLKTYEISEGDERFSLFNKMLAGGNIPPAYYQQVIAELLKITGTLQAHDEYDAALKLVNMGAAAARVQRDIPTVTEITQRVKEIGLQKTAYARAKAAKETLAKNPADPAANEAWGAYQSFTKGEFLAGLPYLARGASADLTELAKRELADNKTQPEQMSLADDWWAYSEKVPDSVRAVNIRQHAGQKYADLFPKLSGIEKAKAEKRIAELKTVSDQKGKREVEQMMANLYKAQWKIDWQNGGNPETLEVRPDGSCVNRVFTSWKIENNQLILMGGTKVGETYPNIGKLNFNFVKFELEYFQNGTLVNTGIGRPVN